MYRRAAASICLPVEAKGPVMGKISPTLKLSWAQDIEPPNTPNKAKAPNSTRFFICDLQYDGHSGPGGSS